VYWDRDGNGEFDCAGVDMRREDGFTQGCIYAIKAWSLIIEYCWTEESKA
jgi:hypothetical protein